MGVAISTFHALSIHLGQRRPLTGGAVLLVVMLCLGCDAFRHPQQPANVVLIVMDTVRADHLSCYGYSRPTTPSIDSLSAGATLFSRAMAPAPWTLPTHASIFTGKDPFEHGAHRLPPEPGKQHLNPLHADHVTLAEVFSEAGYATAGFAANDGYLTPRWQLDQGFQRFVAERGDADEINAAATRWLRQAGQPFFVFMNYMDTHKPYNASVWPGFVDDSLAVRGDSLLNRLTQVVMEEGGSPPADLVPRVIAQYDAALATLDHEIGTLLNFLSDANLFENTLIVITADHGEAFGEHGVVMHGSDVYQELLRVPLVIKAPGQTDARRDDRLVSLSDLPYLMLSAINNRNPGISTNDFPNAPGNHPVIAENYYARTKRRFRAPVRTAVFDWPHKYIDSSDGQSELYNLSTDPNESNNRLRYEPGTVRRLKMVLDTYRNERGTFDSIVEMTPLDSEEIQKLKALGYIVR